MVSSRWALRARSTPEALHAGRPQLLVLLAFRSPVGSCSLLAGHFEHGPRSKLFSLAEHDLAASSPPQENPGTATGKIIGFEGPSSRDFPGSSSRLPGPGPLNCVTLVVSRYRLCFVVFGFGWEEKDQFLGAPFLASLDVASKPRDKRPPGKETSATSIGNIRSSIR